MDVRSTQGGCLYGRPEGLSMMEGTKSDLVTSYITAFLYELAHAVALYYTLPTHGVQALIDRTDQRVRGFRPHFTLA